MTELTSYQRYWGHVRERINKQLQESKLKGLAALVVRNGRFPVRYGLSYKAGNGRLLPHRYNVSNYMTREALGDRKMTTRPYYERLQAIKGNWREGH